MSDQPKQAPFGDAVALKMALVRRAMEQLYVPTPAEATFPEGGRGPLYDFAARSIGDGPITYLEFGVRGGASMRQMAQRFRHPDTRFVGFDSFEGLPEQWGRYEKGHFSTGGKVPQSADKRMIFVKGWFQNTVPEYLAAHPVSGPVLVHLDADLYSSTLFLLTTLWHHVLDYHVVWDDFAHDVVIALHDFKSAYPIELAFSACVAKGQNPRRPLHVFGRLRKVAFNP